MMNLEELRNDIILKQKKGLPFIASLRVCLLLYWAIENTIIVTPRKETINKGEVT